MNLNYCKEYIEAMGSIYETYMRLTDADMTYNEYLECCLSEQNILKKNILKKNEYHEFFNCSFTNYKSYIL
jgi:hypothetical protein